MSVKLKVLKVDQPIGEFFIGAIDSRALNAIATVEVRNFVNEQAADIAGIQRHLSRKRVAEISDYVNFDYATFPTSVILAIDERNVNIGEIPSCAGLYDLTISAYEGTADEAGIPLDRAALIIDGQHRLAGLRNLHMDKHFEVNVSIFVGADLADKAEIFSTVNLAQTKVNRSLVYDLFDYANKPSPFKMAHDVAVALDKQRGGPFERKIKRLGIVTPGRDAETLSQATVVAGILRHMPPRPEFERNKGFLGLASRSEAGEDWRRYIFSPFYRKNDSVSVLLIMSNYFDAIRRKWPGAWDDKERGFVLNRTNGYNALMRFLQDAYLHVGGEGTVPDKDKFYAVFDSMSLTAGYFTTENIKPGSSGASELYKKLLEEASL